jgi:hypothetical protein
MICGRDYEEAACRGHLTPICPDCRREPREDVVGYQVQKPGQSDQSFLCGAE